MRDDELAWEQGYRPLLREPETMRLVRAFLSESSDEVGGAMLDAPRLTAWRERDRPFDLRESYVLLCSHFGHDVFAVRQFRRLIERPATRSFDGIDVTMAPHPTTTRAVVDRATPEARMALEQWVFSELERRESAANEWIALAQWCSSERAAECFARAMSLIEQREEPFEAALLPRALQERTWPTSERRIRAWFDARARRSPDDGLGREDDHFRCRWFAPDNAGTIRAVVPLFERGVVAVGTSFGESVRRWLHDADACFDPAIDAALDAVEPLHSTHAPIVRLDDALYNLEELFENASALDRERWIDALVDRCPTAYERMWRWATDRQRDRMLAHVRRSARARAVFTHRSYFPTDSLELVAACMDQWVRLGCPLSRALRWDLVAIRRHFADGRRDPRRNGWQLNKDALRERLSAELARGSLDWVIDPGPWWVSAMLGDDPSSRELLDSLGAQVRASRSQSATPYLPLRLAQPSGEPQVVHEATPAYEPRPEQVLWDRLKTADCDEGLRVLREAFSVEVAPHSWDALSWIARVSPERAVLIGDRLIEVILAYHAIAPLPAVDPAP